MGDGIEVVEADGGVGWIIGLMAAFHGEDNIDKLAQALGVAVSELFQEQ